MIDPKKEKQSFQSEKYLKTLESKEEYKKESKIRMDIKKNDEKYYLNAIIENYDKSHFRTKGFSIFRYQLPELIKALQNIHDGQFDNQVDQSLSAAGIIKQTFSENNNYDVNLSGESEHEKYDSWFTNLTEAQKKEVKELERSGWKEPEIQLAFNSKYS
jgi:hypothetical protein